MGAEEAVHEAGSGGGSPLGGGRGHSMKAVHEKGGQGPGRT